MLKYLLMLLFLIPLSLFNKLWWVVHVGIVILRMFVVFFCVVLGEYRGLSYFFGLDLLSYSLVLLRCWICFLMLTASLTVYRDGFFSELFMLFVLLLLLFLVCSFCRVSMFGFYLFFESSLIPTLFLIVG